MTVLEREVPVMYVQSGMFPQEAPLRVETVRAIPNLGISETGDTVSGRTWLLVRKGSMIVMETVQLYSGEKRYVTDHGTMPMSVTWRPGGGFDANALVKGDLSTTGLNPVSKALFLTVKALSSKCLLKALGYYIGVEAMQKYRAGFRFTDGVTRPREYDLMLTN